MPRKSQITSEDIKIAARQQMRQNGTAGVSLRAIGRALGVTAPAIYNYFPRLDDLITALIVDAFNALADHLESTRDRHASLPYPERFRAVLAAYREWALHYPTEFQLIYGNPIPGYQAPRDVTVPAVMRGGRVLIDLTYEALQNDAIHIAAVHETMPEAVRAHLSMQTGGQADDDYLRVMYLSYSIWTHLHGIIMLELHNHLQGTVGDTDSFFEAQLAAMMRPYWIDA